MKRIFVFCFVAFSMLSCNFFHRKAYHAINFARANYADQSQLALDTLMRISNPEHLPAKYFADWALYYTYTLYQLDSIPPNDSIINIACEYYYNSKHKEEDGLAHFLRAYILKENNPDEAIEMYKHTIACLRGTDELNELGVAAFNIGYLYFLDENYIEALKYHRKAERCFKEIRSDVNLAYTYREIANVKDLQKQSVDTVLYYFDKAMFVFDTLNYKDDYYDVGLYKAMTLTYRTDRLDEAKQLLYDVYNYFDRDPYYHIRLSHLYVVRNEYDSALHYLQLSGSDTTNIYAKATYYKLESNVHAMAGNYSKAYSSSVNYIDNRLKVIDETKKHQLYRIDKRFDFKNKELENSDLRVRNRTILAYLSLLAAILLVTIMFFMYVSFKRRKADLNYQLQLEKLKNQHQNKRALLVETLKARAGNALQLSALEAKVQKLTVSDVLNEVKGFSAIPEVLWPKFIEDINVVGNDFICSLTSAFPALTLLDKIVIALISLNVDITDACILLNINKNTMYRRRNTIKERLQLDKSVDLDEWINDYIEKQNIATIGGC